MRRCGRWWPCCRRSRWSRTTPSTRTPATPSTWAPTRCSASPAARRCPWRACPRPWCATWSLGSLQLVPHLLQAHGPRRAAALHQQLAGRSDQSLLKKYSRQVRWVTRLQLQFLLPRGGGRGLHLRDYCHKEVVWLQVELPLGATEDRICGTIDIEKALQEGVKAYEPGLLVRFGIRPHTPACRSMDPCKTSCMWA